MPPPPDYRYNFDCYGIAPKSTAYTARIDSGIFPLKQSNIRVFNIGKTDIFAELLYGTAVTWYGVITSADINAGYHTVLNNGGKIYYITGTRIRNKGDVRALVQCAPVSGYPIYTYLGTGGQKEDFDINGMMKTMVVFGVGKIPYFGDVIATFLDFFWPEEKEDVWDQIKDRVENLIDNKVLEAIKAILGGELRRYKERIFALESELEDKDHKYDTASHYMNIAEDMIGLEQKFIFTKSDLANYENTNYYLLPLYSTLVMMKAGFYRLGIVNKEKIGINDEQVSRVTSYNKRLLESDKGAFNYINNLYKNKLASEYETCEPNNVFNALAAVRSYAGMNGLEYIPAWKSMLNDPFSTKKAYCDVVLYSTAFGRPTAYQAKQMIFNDPYPPLAPKLVNGKRLKLTAIQVFIWRERPGSTPFIGGLRSTYENGDYYTMGMATSESHLINFNEANLIKMQVWGFESLDCLKFTFSDGRVLSYGTQPQHNVTQVFELQDHHICSVFAAPDTSLDSKRAINISASYILTV